MRTRNPTYDRSVARTRGHIGSLRAGGSGISLVGPGAAVDDITDVELVGLSLYDTGDGTAQIVALGGGSVFDVMDPLFGATGDGVTDDTVAIQAAITAAYTAGGGTIYFPPGVYVIGGALQDTGAFNGQLLLPDVAASSAVDHIVLTFKGALRPGFHPLFGDAVPLAAGLSVLKSTLTGASGTAACISGGNAIASASDGNNLEVNIENLVCLAPDDPTFTFWNLQPCQGGEVHGLQISTPGAAVGTPTLPTHTNAYAIKLPQALFANNIHIDGLAAGGFYTGVLWGELTESTGPLILGPTYYGIEIPLTYYPGIIFQLTATNVVRVIRPTGAPSGHKASHGLDILQYVRESAGSGSFNTEYDLYDPSNYGSGYIRYYNITAAGGGAVDTFLQSGGTGYLIQQLGGAWGPGFATPAIVLGTAAAAGSASTVIRSDATIVAFDATVPVTQAFSDAAATGSAAVAARRDHKHGMPAAGSGIGEILISDTPSTPLIFADLLQNEAQDDLLYADP